jgi:murein lipoprotein
MSESTLIRLRRQGLVIMAAALIGLSGCATTGNTDMAALKAQVDAASADASSAKADAAAARSTAADALRTANEAKATADDTETRVDRMFKKAMHK